MLKALYSLPSPNSTVPSVSTPSTSHTNSLTRASRAASGFSISAAGSVELDEFGQQFRHLRERNHVRPIAQGAIWFGMRLYENAIGAGYNGAARQHRSELALAARLVSAASWQLNRMRGVEDHRDAKGFHDWNGPHVGNQIVVTESGPTLGDHELASAGLGGLFDDLSHFCGRKELTFLDVHDFSGLDGGVDQVGLTAQKCWNLKDIDDLSSHGGLLLDRKSVV